VKNREAEEEGDEWGLRESPDLLYVPVVTTRIRPALPTQREVLGAVHRAWPVKIKMRLSEVVHRGWIWNGGGRCLSLPRERSLPDADMSDAYADLLHTVSQDAKTRLPRESRGCVSWMRARTPRTTRRLATRKAGARWEAPLAGGAAQGSARLYTQRTR